MDGVVVVDREKLHRDLDRYLDLSLPLGEDGRKLLWLLTIILGLVPGASDLESLLPDASPEDRERCRTILDKGLAKPVLGAFFG